MTIKSVVFDFGGVLMRTEDNSGRVHWEKKLGLEEGELSQLVFNSSEAKQASLGLLEEDDIWKVIRDRFALSEQDNAAIQSDFWAGDILDESLIAYIQSLHGEYVTAILSNAWPGARQRFKEKYQLDRCFDRYLISAEEGIAKPDPLIYHRLADILDMHMDEIVFVDDFPENISAACKLGIHGIRFINRIQTIEEINITLSKHKQ